jgi:hypothetical protein
MNSDPDLPIPDANLLPTDPTEATLIEIKLETITAVDADVPDANEQLKLETEALVAAIKRRAQAEVKGAGDLTRDAYLNAVRQAREAIEQNRVFDSEQIEYSIWLIRKEAEKNFQAILDQVVALGDRLGDAAEAAWNTLIAPKPETKSDEQL